MEPALAAPASLRIPDRRPQDDPRLAEALRAWRRGALEFQGRYKGHHGFEAAVESLYRGHLWKIRRPADLAASWFEAEKPWVGRALAAAGLGLGTDHLDPCLAAAYLRSYHALLPADRRPGETPIHEDHRRERGANENYARIPFAREPYESDPDCDECEAAA